MTNTFPLCFSCRCAMDATTRERLDGAFPQAGRASEHLCLVCVDRIGKEQAAELEAGEAKTRGMEPWPDR